jgi:hypothetical protein
MKKILFIIAAVILCTSPFVAAFSTPVPSNDDSNTKTTATFTHTVFVEEGTTTWCPNCPNAAKALYSMYNSSEYPFYYVALVSDMNKASRDRFWGHYRAKAIPTILSDGGFIQTVGSGSNLQNTIELYRPVIEECGNRTVHPLELTSTVTGHNDAKLDITVTVKNIGTKKYIGFVQSYVTEIESRWKDLSKQPYHFGFLDFAMQKFVVLSPQASKTFTVTFDGAANHGNHTFADITDDNIMVISTVSHIMPHVVAKEEYINMHVAFYVDQTTGATVS